MTMSWLTSACASTLHAGRRGRCGRPKAKRLKKQHR